MGLFNFNATEQNVISAYAKLTGISFIAGIGLALGGYGVYHIAERADNKSNIEHARDVYKEKLDAAEDREKKYKTLYAEADRSCAEANRRIMELRFELQKLQAKLDSMEKSKTEGLGD